MRALERCDDYLTKPFAYEELVARIRALLRRRPPRREQLDLGELTIDRAARRVLARGREVVLSAKEWALLVKLAEDPERVFTRERLLREVWGYRTYVPTRTLESHASRVRCKLARAGLPGYVVNVWGVALRTSAQTGSTGQLPCPLRAQTTRRRRPADRGASPQNRARGARNARPTSARKYP